MPERITEKLTVRLSKTLLMAVMLCALALATAASDIAFAHGGGGGGGGHDEEPEQQETTQEEKEAAKNKQKLFWAKKKMNKALNRVISHQEYMKKKLHSPEAYNYTKEQFVADMNEEDKLQREFAERQKEVRELCKKLDVKEPPEASLTRPSVITPADTRGVDYLESEYTAIEMLFDNSKEPVNIVDTVIGTKDQPDDVRPLGSGMGYQRTFQSPLDKCNYDPLDYDYGDPWLDD